MTKTSHPRSPKYRTDIRLHIGKAVGIRDQRPFAARRAAIRHANAEVRRLWKLHETSGLTHIRGIVIKMIKDVPHVIHQVRIDRESARNGWKRALIFEGPRS